ncbi:MAG TPA: 4-hydroxy-tetrahydrodipicolinate synthase [Thermodesulfobacteriota bacterium]|nr:4-hydroxy-tetrahydrodipicolinate synthase [Thermodesulfobacteriota bacterium]
MRFRGAITALVTPFRDGRVDEPRLRELVERQIAGGIDGLVPCGTTGESPTLSHEEHRRVIEIVVEQTRRRVPVLAGTGSNSTEEALALTRHAREVGADGALLVVPYYNRPTQEGLYQHFRRIAREVRGFPLVLYNIPSRTGVNLLPETVARLTELDNIVGLKEATGNVTQAIETLRLCPPGFALLSGDDLLTLPLLAIGGVGVISVTSNLVPADVKAMVQAWTEGRPEEARRIHDRLVPLTQALFLETNPAPVKSALAMLGLIEGEIRLPLCALSEANARKLREALRQYGLLAG